MGQPATPASDIFAFGVMLYELATGQHPFGANGMLVLLKAIISEPAPEPVSVNRKLPCALNSLILRMLSKHPYSLSHGGPDAGKIGRGPHPSHQAPFATRKENVVSLGYRIGARISRTVDRCAADPRPVRPFPDERSAISFPAWIGDQPFHFSRWNVDIVPLQAALR